MSAMSKCVEMSAISEKNAHFTAKDFQDGLIEGTKHLNVWRLCKKDF